MGCDAILNLRHFYISGEWISQDCDWGAAQEYVRVRNVD